MPVASLARATTVDAPLDSKTGGIGPEPASLPKPTDSMAAQDKGPKQSGSRRQVQETTATMVPVQPLQIPFWPTAPLMPGARDIYVPGATLTAVTSVIMREGSSLDSAFMKRLAPASVVEVASLNTAASGLRLRVRDASKQQGWVSASSGDGTELWASVPAYLRGVHREPTVVRPYWPTDRSWLDEVDHGCFGEGEQLGADWVRLAAKTPGRCFITVAATRAAVVGYCAWGIERPRREDRLGPRLYVASLAVRPEDRGQGIGAQLLKHVEAMGEHRFPEAEFVALHVRQDNAAARRLYERLGFQHVAIISRYSEGIDGWEMVRELGPLRRHDIDPAAVKELRAMGFAKPQAQRALRWAAGNRRLAAQLLQGDVPVVRASSVTMPWVEERS